MAASSVCLYLTVPHSPMSNYYIEIVFELHIGISTCPYWLLKKPSASHSSVSYFHSWWVELVSTFHEYCSEVRRQAVSSLPFSHDRPTVSLFVFDRPFPSVKMYSTTFSYWLISPRLTAPTASAAKEWTCVVIFLNFEHNYFYVSLENRTK